MSNSEALAKEFLDMSIACSYEDIFIASTAISMFMHLRMGNKLPATVVNMEEAVRIAQDLMNEQSRVLQ
jgi:hypothetical protein